MEGTGVGKYEFKPISTVSGDGITVTFATGILNTYTVDATPSRAQVVLVHQYTTVTVNSGGFLTVGAWDGTKGGVLVFRATGAVTINDGGGALSGSISVKGKGMRAGTIGSNGNGQGKGLAMGGGGTNLTPGSVERLIAAGSGAGSTTAASTGHAGGIIIIKTNSDFNLNGSYTTSYNDDTGQTGAGGVIAQGRVTTGANSGGGAGGTVYIVANNFKTTASCGTVKVDGGAGNGSGVAGGSGRIFIRYKTTLSCSSAGGPANVTTYQKFTEK